MSYKYQYCKQCVYPFFGANLTIKDGICSACQSFDKYYNITKEEWNIRKKTLQEIFKEKKNNNNYDCVIPVSGGKDSFFQTHYAINELGLKPLQNV